LAALASKEGYRTFPGTAVKDPAFADWIREEQVDLILNVNSLYLIHESILRAPLIGAFNLHPGPLPECAGLNSVSWAIYHGAESHGVTLHWMAPGIDTGDIAYQARFPIEPDESPFHLMHRCVQRGIEMTEELLAAASLHPQVIPRIPQDLSRRRYFGKKAPQDGRIRWDLPAASVANFVRACDYAPFPSPWGHPSTVLFDRQMEVIKVTRTFLPCGQQPGTVRLSGEGGLHVACADEWLALLKLNIDGRFVTPAELLTSAIRSCP